MTVERWRGRHDESSFWSDVGTLIGLGTTAATTADSLGLIPHPGRGPMGAGWHYPTRFLASNYDGPIGPPAPPPPPRARGRGWFDPYDPFTRRRRWRFNLKAREKSYKGVIKDYWKHRKAARPAYKYGPRKFKSRKSYERKFKSRKSYTPRKSYTSHKSYTPRVTRKTLYPKRAWAPVRTPTPRPRVHSRAKNKIGYLPVGGPREFIEFRY